MNRRFLFACGVALSLAACNKPSEGDCKKAIGNIKTLLGTDRMSTDSGVSAAWIRTCRGGAKKSSVKCAMEASTIDQLRRCGILKNPEIDALLSEPAPAPIPTSAAPPAAGHDHLPTDR